ncbi:MAG TPA: BTAD domain-containing putative transcriptional regulator [Gaiellaceae bacterium]|nr:BTAD domain-containing putative transcriptional regulator [Gaiellaceae bacterium]
MEVLLLGPFEVRAGGHSIPLRRKKHRALIALLALHPREVVSSDRLVEELWGSDEPKTARQALQNYVSLLRKQLGPESIETRSGGYALGVDPEQVDAMRFERLVMDARRLGTAAERAASLRAALDLWRGAAFEDLLYEPFAELEARRLEELRLSAREDLADAELEEGRHAALVPELEELVAGNPYRERLRAQLMLALYRAGRQADALEAYRAAREALAELGLDPSAQLRLLEKAVLNQDPALDVQTVLPDIGERRKTVTVLLCDVAPEAPDLDPEQLRARTVRALAEARAAIELHGGSVETRAGDELLGVFGLPIAHEDDPLRAMRAAAKIRTLQPKLRVGIDTGEVVTGRGFVSGDVVARAKRLQRDARPGQALLGSAAIALCGKAVTAQPTGAKFRLLAVEEHADAPARAFDGPLVGREEELGALRDSFEEACRTKSPGLVSVLGEPGIGKTRLARELVAELGERAAILVGRCVSYGEGATWLPLREMLAQAGERLDSILATAASTGEIFLETRQVFERLARTRPLVLVWDDAHWGEPTLLDLVEYLAAQAAGPILCLCLSRPEVVESRPALAKDAVRLAPLGEREAETLAADLDAGPGAGLLDAAGGNPLFLEQLIAFRREGGAGDAVPPSLESLIASRLDLLGPEEQDLLQRAAVVGRTFERAQLLELGGMVERLTGLEDKGFVRRLAGGGYGFHHVLVRQVAYASVSKALRAELHEQLADLLADRSAPDELIGYHLEQAHRFGAELQALDGRLRRLGLNAGERLGAAGVEAWKRVDSPAAVNLLTRACALLPERDPFRLELLCYLGTALHSGGALTRAEEVLEDAAGTASAAGNRPREARARLELAYVRLYTDPEGRAAEVIALAQAGIPLFEALDDQHALGRAWRFLADVQGAWHCHYAAGVEAAEHALAHCLQCDWPTSSCVGALAAYVYFGPEHVDAAIERCNGLAATSSAGDAAVFTFLGGLEAMRGQFDDARQLVSKARRLYTDLGMAAAAEANAGTIAAQVEVLAGEHAAAEEILRATCASLERMGDLAYLATRAAELANVLWHRGCDLEAEDWVSRALELGASDDIPTQILWRCAAGKLLAHRGEVAEAQRLVGDAIRLSDTTDALNYQARARLDLARVLGIASRLVEASAAAEAAIEIFDRKGNVAEAERARALLAEFAVA